MANTPLNNITIDGKLYDVLNTIPKKEHELIYTEKIDNVDTLVTRPLMVEGIYVVEDEKEFDKCAKIGVETPKILDEWVQYSDRVCMSEYGKGLSINNNGYKSNISYGYGYWSSDSELNISNTINSTDYNGYINPQKSNKFNYTSIIGSNKGGTTGDWGGFALIDDSHAVARHIIDTDGNIYYRNTLYDLFNNAKASPFNEIIDDKERTNLWCAWVNEDRGKGVAYVIYGDKKLENSYYVDNFPNGDVNVYRINNIKTREERIIYEYYKTTTISSTQESYGYVVTLNILTQNTSGIDELRIGNTGTIIVFTNIFPCGTNRNDTSFNITNSNKQCFIVNPNGQTNVLLGTTLVPYDSTLDLNGGNKYCFIRSDLYFDNGVLKIYFSDAKGKSNETMPNDYLDTKNININFPLNGSELIIDFKNYTCNITPYDEYDGSESVLSIGNLNDLLYSKATYEITEPDGNGGNKKVNKEINVFDSFNGNVKFMYIAHSFQNLKYKCNGLSYHDRLIIDNRDNSVWLYNNLENEYIKQTTQLGIDYFTGSHISYNEITNKLFYSNGSKITCIARNCGCFDDTTNNINNGDIISVIIPDYEQDDEPVGLTSDDIGKYWFSVSEGILYQYEYDFDDDEYKFVESDKSVKFINNANDGLYIYSDENKIWDLNGGIENKIYVSINTNEMYYWVNELSEFLKFSGENDVLNTAIHFTEIGGVFEDTEDMPEASSVTYQYLLCKKNDPNINGSDIYYSLFKKARLLKPLRIGWKSVIGDNDTVIKINNIDNEGDDLLFKKIESDGNIFYEPKTIDDFLDNVYYINDNNGDVYSWNGYDLVKLTNDELENILPKNNTFIVNFNSRHDLNLNKPLITYGGGAVVDDTDINSYTAEGEHTVIAINSETSKQTRFYLKIYKYNGYIYQDLYNNDVSYVRKKSSNSWSSWNITFTKTNLTLDVQQVSFSKDLNEKFKDKTIKEFDKKIQIKPKTNDDEFIKINEEFLHFNFYRRYNRHKKTKWWFVGKRVMYDGTTTPVMTTSNGVEYEELSFNLSDCNRGYKKILYELPFTLKDLMNNLIKVSGSVNDNGTVVYVNDLNGVMKYGCGTEFTPDVQVWRETINTKHNQFLTYGYKDNFKITDVSSPSISMIIGLNLSFGSHTSDGTEIIPYKIKVKFRHSNVNNTYWCGDIVYGMTNVLTNSVFK